MRFFERAAAVAEGVEEKGTETGTEMELVALAGVVASVADSIPIPSGGDELPDREPRRSGSS